MAPKTFDNAFRLPEGGSAIDRSRKLSFTVNGKSLTGFAGDTLASALIANGWRFIGRSFKYHRPRGFVASGVEEPNGLFGIGRDGRFEPNQRGTMVEIYDGLSAKTQNHFPSLEYDIGTVNAQMARMFPAGFYYKTFMKPRIAWKYVFEPFIRQAAGLGKAPSEADPDEYEHYHHHCDVLIAGGGVAGVVAALAAGAAGARVLLVEQSPRLGGRALVEDATVDGEPIAEWLKARIAELEAMPSVTIRTRTQASWHEDHNYALCYERVTDHEPGAFVGAPRHRLWRVRAGRIIAATGAIERPLSFACNDVPGVMLASAMRDYVSLYAAKPGERVVVYANNDDAYRTAIALRAAGVEVPAIVDSRDGANGDLPQIVRREGIRTVFGAGVSKTVGKRQVEGVEISGLRATGRVGATEAIECDAVAMSGGWSPAVHLWSHCGGKLLWDETALMFRPDPARPPTRRDGEAAVRCAGRANGVFEWLQIIRDGWAAGADAARLAGFTPPGLAAPEVEDVRTGAPEPMWFAPAAGKESIGSKHFLDFQNDVTVTDVELAAREGYESVEHAKRYTTLGMATDQGKLSNINGLAILADVRRVSIPEVGTTTFRPPYTPISLGSVAGREKGALFKPVRRTPMHGWHEAQGATWEPVGDWRRPYCYPRKDPESGAIEDKETAIRREILTVRRGVGALDASTLGKIQVQGPDAAELLDRIYTNKMSSLRVGRCRYGLMCDDNGYLFDDGVVVRLGEDSFLCHTTSGGSDRVHAWLEEWLQTEWFDLKAFVQNVTDQWAQIVVAGPKARDLLETLTTPDAPLDLSDEGLPFMSMREGKLAGRPVRAHRISFSGELSFEIATPAAHGRALWEEIFAAGAAHDIAPYGTEALHVMRAEVGYIMIGDETDGTVTPWDLGLSWAVSKKKADFIGKRAMERPFLCDPDRKRLVGLRTENAEEVLPTGALAVEKPLDPGEKPTPLGHVTSSYWSPTLERSVAMALIRRGPERMGETLTFSLEKGATIRATVVEPKFYDPSAPPPLQAKSPPETSNPAAGPAAAPATESDAKALGAASVGAAAPEASAQDPASPPAPDQDAQPQSAPTGDAPAGSDEDRKS